jgi:hypothetical protein
MLGFLVDMYVVFETRPANNLLAILWAPIVFLYWQAYFYIRMMQNLFRKSYAIKRKTKQKNNKQKNPKQTRGLGATSLT